MIELRRVPVLRVLVPFTAGSLLGAGGSVPAGIYTVLTVNSILWVWLVVVFGFLRKGPVFLSGFFCFTACILFMVAGYGTGMLVRPLDPKLPLHQEVLVRGEILEEARPVNWSWTMEMRLRLVADGDSCSVANTIVKLYMDMPPDSVLPAPGEVWQFHGVLNAISNSGNPGEPDYERILHRKNCWYNFYAADMPALNLMVIPADDRRMLDAAIRKALSDHWEGRPDECSLLKAVCLGDRSGLTGEMEVDFSRAGGMHILAVSGLHVGLIWWVLYHILSVVTRITRRELFRTLIILVILWGYAWITGFSSPVSRAVTMCSLLTVSRLLDRRSGTVNAILVSAFLLIVLDPGRVLEVGFQLSYSAVLGIVTLQPRISGLLPVRNRILRWVRDATGVSIAAQVATGPLVAYYFHQLPTYAILTNLVAVPLLSCIIALFVVSTPFLATGCLTWLFSWPLSRLSALLSGSMAFIGSFPGAVIGDLHPDSTRVMLILILILLVIFVLHDRRNLFRYLLAVHLACILGINSWSRYQTISSSEFVAAHLYGGSLLIFREGVRVDYYMWTRDSLAVSRIKRYMATSWGNRRYRTLTFHMNDLEAGKGSVTACQSLCRGIWQVGNDHISGVVFSGTISPGTDSILAGREWDFILLSGEPRFTYHSEWRVLSGQDVIVDGSNRTWFSEQLNLSRGAYRSPGTGRGGTGLYLTRQHGAYVKRW